MIGPYINHCGPVVQVVFHPETLCDLWIAVPQMFVVGEAERLVSLVKAIARPGRAAQEDA
jgi:hypothetical protein